MNYSKDNTNTLSNKEPFREYEERYVPDWLLVSKEDIEKKIIVNQGGNKKRAFEGPFYS